MDRTCGLDSTRPCAIRAATAKLVSMHLTVERLYEALGFRFLPDSNDCMHTARLTMPAESALGSG